MASEFDKETGFSRKIPAWYQLAMLLRADILSGALPGGAQIESELQLAAKYDLSVMPVRQALKSLEAEGLVTRQRGRGTFVTAGHQARGFTSLQSLYSTEHQTPADILERGLVEPPEPFREAFKDHEKLAFMRRVAYRDGKPWSYGTLYSLPEIDEKISTALLRKFPVYRLMEEKCGVHVRQSQFTVKAVAASPEVAHYLQIEPFTAILNMTAISSDADERLIGAFDMNFISDSEGFRFQVPHTDGL